MGGFSLFVLILLALAVVLVFQGIKSVPQGLEYTVGAKLLARGLCSRDCRRRLWRCRPGLGTLPPPRAAHACWLSVSTSSRKPRGGLRSCVPTTGSG
jgi:hypothetical protein